MLIPASGGGNVKYYTNTVLSTSTAINSAGSAVATVPSDATEVLALIPLAINPNEHWPDAQHGETLTGIWATSVVVNTRTISFTARGTSMPTQTFAVNYLVIYK